MEPKASEPGGPGMGLKGARCSQTVVLTLTGQELRDPDLAARQAPFPSISRSLQAKACMDGGPEKCQEF